MAAFSHHTQCPKCDSSDAYAVYSDSSGHCFSCLFTKPSDELLEANQNKQTKKKGKSKLEQALEEEPTKATDRKEKPIVTEEETAELKSRTTVKAPTYRGIRPETMSIFGVRTEFEEATGEPCAIYYPCTQENELTGWKPRTLPKSFGGSIGRTGATCQLFGQFKFTRPSKVCLIVGGENDALSAYQMLSDYIKSKAGDYEIAVVSPTIGETGCSKQLAAQYTFFDKYEKIIVGFDNDKAGREATEKVMDALPKGKVFIATWKYKDPNEYLEKGQDRAFISDYFNAKAYVPAGVVGSNELSEAMREELRVPKVPLPPFMHKVQDMMAGGIPLGRIVNLGSASGTGKSTIIDECIYYWIFNSPHRIGIVSLESSKGQYGLKILSRHVSNKIELMDNDAALTFIDSPEVLEKEYEVFYNADGTPRFHLVDERDAGIEGLKTAIENLIIGCGVRLIVLDPLQDILAGLDDKEQELFMAWQKGMIKSHGVTFVNISHIRKSGGGQKANSTGADIFEEDFHGSSSIFKSGAVNLLFSRDKENEDPILRNTTIMKMSKCRWTGKTGKAGEYYYDNQTHTMHDKDDWVAKNGAKSF